MAPTERNPLGEQPSDDEFVYRAIVETAEPEILSTLLTAMEDCLGTEFVDDVPDDLEQTHPPGTVVAYFDADSPDSALRIQQRIDDEVLATVSFEATLHECNLFTDDSWRESWKEFFTPIAIGPDVWVGPPWEAETTRQKAGPDGTALIVDPGMAFGTGHHETTRLSGHMLADAIARFDGTPSVLDVGCGSGVLSMLAADAGATPVAGIDISRDAIDAARDNAERNGFDALEFRRVDLADIPDRYDIVVANILDEILLYLRDDLYDHVAPDGRLLVSGIPDERADRFRDEFFRDDWELFAEDREGKWHAFTLTPPRTVIPTPQPPNTGTPQHPNPETPKPP